MSADEVAGPSLGPKRRKKNNNNGYLDSAVTGLMANEVNDILRAVEPSDLYISSSEEESFVDSGSEYLPSSSSESDNPEMYQSSDEMQEPNNIQDYVSQERESLVVGKVLDQKELEIFWTKNEFHPHVHEFDSTNSGLQNQDLTENSKEVNYFLNLFTEEIA